MAKHYITFDEKVYTIDESALAPATDALKAHLGTLGGGEEGGSLDYGTTVKFKNVTDDDMYTLIDNLGLDKITDLYTILAIDTNRTLAMLVGSDGYGLYFQTIDISNNNNLIASYVLSFSDLKWFDGITQEELSSPPTITILPDAPPEPQYELSQFEPLFDLSSIAGNDGDLDITLDGAVYKVDSTKLAPATNSLIAHLETLKGGESGGSGLEFGKEYKFKDAEAMTKVLPEINEIISSIPETDGAKIICTNTENGTTLATMPDAIVIGRLSDNMMIASYRAVEYSAELGGMTVKSPAGWYSGLGGVDIYEAVAQGGVDPTDDPNVVIARTSEPPTFVFPAEGNLDTACTMEQISLFFDIPTSGNEGDTKIVINGVEYPVDSAKLADAKSALAAHLEALEDASN